MQQIQIANHEFNAFRELIYNETGIKLSDLKKALVQARISRRCRVLGIQTFKEYHDYLLDHYNIEKIEFINAITTNKTDFFRENKHFDFMNKVILPDFEKSGKNKLRIWSAGCSTGEEPYTIALTLHEYFKNKKKPDIKILATDIDTTVLEKGQNGIYKTDAMEGVPLYILKEYFFRGRGENEGLFKVKDVLKKYITYRRLNLMDKQFPMKGTFDIIFCRNVIIYFEKHDQAILFEKIKKYSDAGGWLFIGHSENISNIADGYKLVGNTIYQREE